MSGVQFGQQIDMNGFKITELAPGVAGTDAVNVNQLTASGPQGFAVSVGDGSLSTFTVTHNFNTFDVMTQVYEVATGNYYATEARIATVNTVEVSFGAPPASNQFRVLVIPVP